MTAETIAELLRAVPFIPFKVYVAEQKEIAVPHSGFALLTKGGRVLVVNTEGDKLQHIDVLLVTRVETAEPASR